MKNTIKILLAIFVAMLLGGCMMQQPTAPSSQKSTFIVMKTPVFKYADQGFVHKSSDKTNIEIYSSGVAVMKLEIGSSQVCNGTGLFSCMSKSEFNKRFLSMNYPDDTLERIFRGEKVFGGAGTNQVSGGFTQKISRSGAYDIEYSALDGNIVFRDTLSHILIKIRDNG